MSTESLSSHRRPFAPGVPPVERFNPLFRVRIRDIWRFLTTQPASYWLICTYLFLEYVRPQSIYPGLDVLPWTQTVIIMCTLAFVVERYSLRVRGWPDIGLLFFVSIVLASSVAAYSPEAAFRALPVFLTWILIYFLITNIVRTEPRFLVFVLSFLLYNFKMSQHAVRSWARIGFSFRDWGVAGAPGWFRNSGEFGVEMCIFLPLSVYFVVALWRHWSVPRRLFFGLLPITAIIGMVASSSRGALVGGAAASFWMLVQSRHKARALVLLGVVATAAITVIPPEQISRFETAGEDRTSSMRLDRWDRAIRFGNEHPVLGIGYGNWGVYSREQGFGHSLAHNIFLDAFAELGYTGLLGFLLLIGTTFLVNHRTRRRAVRTLGPRSFCYYMAHGLDAALVGYLASGFFVSVLYYPFFWINLAMTTALHRVVSLESGSAARSRQRGERISK